MLEIPESYTISRQISEKISGRTIVSAVAGTSPHKFAWFFGDPADYPKRLNGRRIDDARPVGGLVEIRAEKVRIVLGDGTSIRLVESGCALPEKHQLLLNLDDGSAMVCSVQMYGSLWAFEDGSNDNPYYRVALEKPSPLQDAFDADYFDHFLAGQQESLPAKALLATGQRIPGLGNGVLQDILFNAKIHPKRKLATFGDQNREALFTVIKGTLADMAGRRGRDTEKDLFGLPGDYKTLMSQKTAGQPCPGCGSPVRKEAYLGGSVYYCPACQRLA